MNLKSLVKQITPPVIISLLRQENKNYAGAKGFKESVTWQGNHKDWKTAASFANGYNDNIIFDKVRSSLLKVKNGEAVYERDSVLFDKIQYSWPILACLENIALAHGGSLHIVDFGGSLGSSYFQNRSFFTNLNSFKWVVVEQKHFVECGKNEFEDAYLKFEYSIDEVLKNQSVHCLLLSGVLQYLPDPVEWINKFCNYNIDYIILDRTGFIKDEQHILTIQNVSEEIYQASYPCWFFNEDQLIKHFSGNYEVIADFNDSFTPSTFIDGRSAYWKGFYLKRK